MQILILVVRIADTNRDAIRQESAKRVRRYDEAVAFKRGKREWFGTAVAVVHGRRGGGDRSFPS